MLLVSIASKHKPELPTFLLPVKMVGPGKNVHIFIWQYAYCHEYIIFPVTAAFKLVINSF